VVFDRTQSDGMYFSVICAEDADFSAADIPLDGVRPQIAKDAAKDLREGFQDICNFWQVETLAPFVDEPVASDIPALLLSGQFDPITPSSNAAVAAQFLINSHNIVDPTGSHGVMRPDACMGRIVQDFLDDPLLQPDTSCLSTNSPSAFVPPNVLRVPLLNQINFANESALIQTLLAGLFLAGVLSVFVVWPLAFLINLLRKSRRKFSPAQKWLRWTSRGLVILFGISALIFVVGLNIFVIQALSGPVILVSSVSGRAAPLFLIPFLLILLALAVLVVMLVAWFKSGWSIWGRLYYTFLTICIIGYVVLLGTTGMFGVLL